MGEGKGEIQGGCEVKKKTKTRTDYAVEVTIPTRTIYIFYFKTKREAKKVAKEESFSIRTVKIWKRTWEVV